MRTLRPHQTRAVTMLREAIRTGSRRPMLMAPTGAGKTVLASAIINSALERKRRVIFTVPAISLVDQTAREFFAEGIRDIGVIQADHPMTDPSKPVQIASIDTLRRRSIPEAHLVLIDEAHRISKFVEDWMTRDEWIDVPFIGLSATPWTKGLGRLYDRLIIAATTEELIRQGFLSQFRVFAPSHPDLSKVRTVAGDYHEGDLAGVMSERTLVADVVTTWLAKADRRPTLCFAVDRVHARTLQAQFEARGVTCGYIDALTPLDERERIRKAFAARELEVVCNVGVLTTGVDWDVRCIVLARPTKSEILYTQIIGRGLRTAMGKADCIARDSLVLTDRGEVRIQDVTLDHKLWDGVQFVSHAGAVCKGVRPVITHDGLTATPDHRVMTDVGWLSLSEAHRRGLGIARTGVGGRAVRLADDSVAAGRRVERQAPGGGVLRALRALAHGPVPQHPEATEHSRVPALQWALAGHGSAVAIPALSVATGSLQQSELDVIRPLWGPWRGVQVYRPERSGPLDCGEPGNSGSVNGDRPGRQRWALRAWEPALGSPSAEHRQQSARPWWARALHLVSHLASGGALRRPDLDAPRADWTDGRADHRPLERPFVQAEGEVWDILNAGPLQRFTANGRLVHNCLILDHSDTTLRLGFVTDIHHDRLNGGTISADASAPQEREPAKPRECPSCHYVRPPQVPTCPACGHVAEKVSQVETVDGELVDLTAQRKANAEDWAAKISFMRQLRAYAAAKGKSEGWTAHKYRAKFGVWPNHPNVKYVAPAAGITPEVRSWIQAQNIRFAKSMDRQRARA